MLFFSEAVEFKQLLPTVISVRINFKCLNGITGYFLIGNEVHIDIYDDRMEIYSPGGMPDGSVIQERDSLTVPSTRRNPVLADVFNRLGYMERKGSSFGKIIGGYGAQVNYSENKKPTFRSDRYQFTVIMPNLNYGVTPNGTCIGTQDDTYSGTGHELEPQIRKLIRENSKISTEKMAVILGSSVRTIKRRIKTMNDIHFVGRGSNGHWEIHD